MEPASLGGHNSLFLAAAYRFLDRELKLVEDKVIQSVQVCWTHLSGKNGDIEAPNRGNEQASSVVADFDNDRINDFAISERITAPAMVWYRRGEKGWTRYIVEAETHPATCRPFYRCVPGSGFPEAMLMIQCYAGRLSPGKLLAG